MVEILQFDNISLHGAPGRFADPLDEAELRQRALDAIPKNTSKRNAWAYRTFTKWIVARNNRFDANEKMLVLLEALCVEDMNKWLGFFVCEVRKVDGSQYPAKTLLSLLMGIQGYLKSVGVAVDILNSPEFEYLRTVLDSEMKKVSSQGVGTSTKQSEVFTVEMEKRLWEQKLLGDHNPKVLVRTILFLNGKNFALRGGEEHRTLRFKCSQITLHEPQGETPYLKYTEDTSKCNQGGLKSRKVNRKVVTQYANLSCPDRCHVMLYKKYMALCPTSGRDGAFYLQPLVKPRDDVWFNRNGIGHNTLRTMISSMCKEAGMVGKYTNHSLRATAATALFQSGISEQAIMDRTGHRSVEGM